MAVVNISDATGNLTVDCTVDEPHFTGSATQNAGTTLIFNPGAGPQASVNPIRFDGSYNWTSSTTGGLQINGTSALRMRVQPNGAATAWPPIAAAAYYIWVNASAAEMTLTYVDSYYITIANWSTASTTNTNLRLYLARPNTGNAYFLRVSASATTTASDIEVYGSWEDGITVDGSGGTVTMQRIHVQGCGRGVTFVPTGGTYTMSEWKITRCGTGINWAPAVAVTATNISIMGCSSPITGTPTADVTMRRWMVDRSGSFTLIAGGVWGPTPGVGRTLTLDEWYVISNSGSQVNNASGAGTHARMPVTSSVLATHEGSIFLAGASSQAYCAGSGNDYSVQSAEETTNFTIYGGTSDNEYLEGCELAWMGAVPAGSENPWANWADTNFTRTYDGDSGNTTSTSLQRMYGGPLAANRTNPRTTPNKPLTITSISSGTPTSEAATITFTTGIRARSRILIGTAAGVTRANATMVSPWKYHGILDPELVDFTLPATSHSHALVNLKANTTYYYVIECYDPCGRRFLGAEASFATTAAAGGGAGRSQFAGAGMRVS